MALLDRDLSWLASEVRDDPDTAQRILEALTGRVQTLQRQTDELRAEIALLKCTGGQQASVEQVQRLKTSLRDIRSLAERKGLNRDVISMLSFSGHGVQLAAPAPIEQTMTLLLSTGDSLDAQKPLYLASGTWFGALLVVTSQVRFAAVDGLSLRYSEKLDWSDAHPVSGLGLRRAERVEGVCALDDLHPPQAILLVTRQGWARVMSWSHVETVLLSGQSMALPGTGDSPVWIGPCEPDADILLLTRNGRWTRFPVGMIPSIGCSGATLDYGDDVVSAVVLQRQHPAAAVWFIGSDGSLFAVAAGGLPAHKKPGGKPAPLARRFVGQACYAVGERKNELVVLLTGQGDLHVVGMRGLPVAAKPSEAQPLKVSSQRIIAATLL